MSRAYPFLKGTRPIFDQRQILDLTLDFLRTQMSAVNANILVEPPEIPPSPTMILVDLTDLEGYITDTNPISTSFLVSLTNEENSDVTLRTIQAEIPPYPALICVDLIDEGPGGHFIQADTTPYRTSGQSHPRTKL